MGRGDKKTKKGKISIGSYGVSRPRKVKATTAPKAKAAKSEDGTEAKKAAPKKKATPKKKAE